MKLNELAWLRLHQSMDNLKIGQGLLAYEQMPTPVSRPLKRKKVIKQPVDVLEDLDE